MAAPVVSWYDSANATQVTNWDLGTVDAGTVSPDTTFLIWNNRAGGTLVSDMTNCALTTKDNAGGNTGELVTNTWIEAKLSGDASFTAIGGAVTKAIKGGGAAAAGTISGAVNDGTVANSATSFATVILHANVPPTATAGNVDFLTRVSYQYV